jgi:hypothetical protein
MVSKGFENIRARYPVSVSSRLRSTPTPNPMTSSSPRSEISAVTPMTTRRSRDPIRPDACRSSTTPRMMRDSATLGAMALYLGTMLMSTGRSSAQPTSPNAPSSAAAAPLSAAARPPIPADLVALSILTWSHTNRSTPAVRLPPSQRWQRRRVDGDPIRASRNVD